MAGCFCPCQSLQRPPGTPSLPPSIRSAPPWRWGSVYDIRTLLDSAVCLMDGRSPLDIDLPAPLALVKKPLLGLVRGTVIEQLLWEHRVLREGML